MAPPAHGSCAAATCSSPSASSTSDLRGVEGVAAEAGGEGQGGVVADERGGAGDAVGAFDGESEEGVAAGGEGHGSGLLVEATKGRKGR